MNKLNFSLLLITTILLFSCSCKKDINNNNSTTDKNVSTKTLNTIEQKAKYNSTKEYTLLIKKVNTKRNTPFPTISFSILNVKNKKIIYKDIIPGGKIYWISDYTIEVKSLLNRPKDILNSNKLMPLYKLDVRTLKKF